MDERVEAWARRANSKSSRTIAAGSTPTNVYGEGKHARHGDAAGMPGWDQYDGKAVGLSPSCSPAPAPGQVNAAFLLPERRKEYQNAAFYC